MRSIRLITSSWKLYFNSTPWSIILYITTLGKFSFDVPARWTRSEWNAFCISHSNLIIVRIDYWPQRHENLARNPYRSRKPPLMLSADWTVITVHLRRLPIYWITHIQVNIGTSSFGQRWSIHIKISNNQSPGELISTVHWRPDPAWLRLFNFLMEYTLQ